MLWQSTQTVFVSLSVSSKSQRFKPMDTQSSLMLSSQLLLGHVYRLYHVAGRKTRHWSWEIGFHARSRLSVYLCDVLAMSCCTERT